jgi:23S rRNA (guanine745-N1)-methyltransferase
MTESVQEGLVCPVRGCGKPLGETGRELACPAGHRFDRARSGYFNLLQPQDRRSRSPGDSREAVQARRRSVQRGLCETLGMQLERQLQALGTTPGTMAIDVGCGEGSMLARLATHFTLQGWGVDISSAAIDMAAKSHPHLRWVVANADRRLPFAEGTFSLVLTITACKNSPEFHRLLRPDGALLVVVPDHDDLAELRERVLGKAVRLAYAQRAQELFCAEFELQQQVEARTTAEVDADGLRDLLAGSYRGGRHRQQAQLQGLTRMRVTLSHRILRWKPRA